jgi:hypothetical protein
MCRSALHVSGVNFRLRCRGFGRSWRGSEGSAARRRARPEVRWAVSGVRCVCVDCLLAGLGFARGWALRMLPDAEEVRSGPLSHCHGVGALDGTGNLVIRKVDLTYSENNWWIY